MARDIGEYHVQIVQFVDERCHVYYKRIHKKIDSYQKKVQNAKRNRVLRKKLGFFALNLNMKQKYVKGEYSTT